jgi:surface-anchored protein
MNRSLILPLLAVAATFALAANVFAAGIWTAGHGDIGLAYEEGELFLHYHLHSSTVDGALVVDVEFDPADIIMYVPADSISRPAGAEWDFTGNAAGEPLWFIDQTQLADRPWPGIGTEELTDEDFVGNLSFTLASFSGPGELSLLTFGPFGEPTLYFQTSDGLSAADAIHVPVNTHAHFAWLFTAPGIYTLDITARGDLTPAAGGGTVTDAGTFTVWVAVPEPASMLLLVGGVLCGCYNSRRRK